MANDQECQGGPGGGPEDLGQDPFVQRLRPDPSQPPEPVRILEGLLGDSDREGYKRLYSDRELDYYAEFRTEDVLFREPIPSEQAPLVGYEATRVGIRRDATVEYTRVRTPKPVDEFDLDVRLAGPRTGAQQLPFDQTDFDDTRCVRCVTMPTGCPTGCPTQCDDTCM